MIDTPDMFSIDISIKKNSDGKKYSKNDINSLLNIPNLIFEDPKSIKTFKLFSFIG